MPEVDRVPFEFAGKTLYVVPEMYEGLTAPDGWGDLTVDELADIGIVPGTSGEGPPTAFFRATEE